MCDCSTSEKFIRNQVPCSYNLKSISFLLVMYTIRARYKIIIGHCIGCIDVMRCVCFQTGFQVTRRPSYCSVDHALPKVFLPSENKPAERLFFFVWQISNKLLLQPPALPPFSSAQSGSHKTNLSLQTVLTNISRACVWPEDQNLALEGLRSICHQWHFHVPGMI